MLINIVNLEFFLGGIFICTIILGTLIAYLLRLRKALQENEERFRAVSTYTSDWEILLAPDGKPLWVNAAAQQMSGLTTAEALAMRDYPLPLVDGADQEAVRSTLELVKEGGIIDDQLFRVRRPDNSSFQGSLCAQKIFSSKGKFLGSRLSIRDVSALTAYQEAVVQKRKLLQSVLDNSSDGIIVLNEEFQVIFFNARFLQLWGLSRAFLNEQPTLREMIHKVCRTGLYPPEEEESLIIRRIQHLKDADARILLETPRQDGRLVEGFAAPLPGIGYLLTYRDVTEGKVAERKEREQAAFIQTILDSVPSPIFYKDCDGRYLGCNTAFERYLGRSRTEVIGSSVFDLAPPDLAKVYADSDAELLRKGGTQSYETQVLFADGRFHNVLFCKAIIPWEDGTARGLVGTMIDISDRKEAEDALFHSERKFHAIFDQAFQYTAILDPTGRIQEINQAALTTIDTTLPEVYGKFFWETPWWQGSVEEQEKIRNAITSCSWGNTLHFETRHTLPNGHQSAIDFSIKPVRDEWGQIIYLIPEGRDISKMKRREEMAMLMARGISAPTGADFFPALVRSLVEVLGANHAFIGNVEGEEVSVIAGLSNGVATAPFRYELNGTPCASALSQGQICSFPQRIQALFPDDHLLQTMAVEGYVGGALCAANGTPLGIMAVLYAQPIKDLPLIESLLKIFVARAASELERRQADAVLQQSEERYRELSCEFETIFNGIPDSLTVWSSEMRLIWANSSSTGHYGIPAAELAGKSCQDVCTFHFEHDPDCEIRRCLLSGKIDERIRKAQDGRSWGIKTFPLHNADGRVDRVIRVASDLTERMILREEAARAAHLAALGELAAGMAHEINNPTSQILLVMPILQEVFSTISEILDEHFLVHGDFPCGGLRYSKMRKELPEMIEDVLEGAARIKYIVAELKDFSHPTESSAFKAVDLNEVVRKAVSLVGSQIKKATNHFTVTYAPVAPQTRGSGQRLEQVVINLLINACQALPDRERSLSVETGTWPDRGRNFIRVSDSGTGILPEHLQLITDPFFTTRRTTGGTGLGLSVSSRIVEEHGGTLFFASKPGEGTIVTIELPPTTKEDSA